MKYTKQLICCALFFASILNANVDRNDIIKEQLKQHIEKKQQAEEVLLSKGMDTYNQHVAPLVIEVQYAKWCKMNFSQKQEENLFDLNKGEQDSMHAFEQHMVPVLAKKASLATEIDILKSILFDINANKKSPNEAIKNATKNINIPLHYTDNQNKDISLAIVKGNLKARKFLKNLVKQYPDITNSIPE